MDVSLDQIEQSTNVGHVAGAFNRPNAVDLTIAPYPRGGLVVACPHSGRFYPPEMLSHARLDAFTLRRSEDAFVDLLFGDAPRYGADLLVSTYARAFVDVNRCATEFDPLLIDNLPLNSDQSVSDRVRAGLGVIPRTVGDSMNIYKGTLSYVQAQDRLEEVHKPWHNAIEARLAVAQAHNGAALLLDCHSMPHAASGDPSVDIILGDRFGASCSPIIMNEALSCLRAAGFQVARNDPYAGGYSTIRHGHPVNSRHALQIEINRSLYMVEGALTQRACFSDIADSLSQLVERLVSVTTSLARSAYSRQ